MDISDQILKMVHNEPEGTLFTVDTFSHIGHEPEITYALQYLESVNLMFTITTGIYVALIETIIGPKPPKTSTVVKNLAGIRNSIVTETEESAAIELELTSIEPDKISYLTSGESEVIQIKNKHVELKHAPGWKLTFPGTKSGLVIRALAWIEEQKLSGETAMCHIDNIREKLDRIDIDKIHNEKSALPEKITNLINQI